MLRRRAGIASLAMACSFAGVTLALAQEPGRGFLSETKALGKEGPK